MPKERDDQNTDALPKRIRDQHQTLLGSIGRGADQIVIDTVKEGLDVASRHPDFAKFEEIPFVYEKLELKTNSMAKIVVDDWIQKPENIQRAARATGRATSNEKLLKAYCAFRFKPWKDQWRRLDGLAIDRREQREHSTVVIIALEPLDQNNGCFVTLEYGEDVCMDGRASIEFPGTGRGLGIFIDLNL